jgi:hypothetical protein
MKLKELTEEVDRYAKGGYYSGAHFENECRKNAAARIVADALTDSSPITKERLLELGGVLNSSPANENCEIMFDLDGPLVMATYWAARNEWAVYCRRRKGEFLSAVFPQPKEMWEIHALLVKLSRKAKE